MLSTRYLPQPYPSYPALCRQDTTCAWSTDYGGNHLRCAWKIWHGCAVDVDGVIVGLLFTISIYSKTSASSTSTSSGSISNNNSSSSCCCCGRSGGGGGSSSSSRRGILMPVDARPGSSFGCRPAPRVESGCGIYAKLLETEAQVMRRAWGRM